MYSIYTLTDPRDNQVRYVGMTTNPEQRYKTHLGMSDYSPVKDAWLHDAIRNNALPVMSIVDQADTEQQARALEAYWILHFHFLGSNLLNKEVYDAKKYNEVEKLITRLKARSLQSEPQVIAFTKDIHVQQVLKDNLQLREENMQLRQLLSQYHAVMDRMMFSLSKTDLDALLKRGDEILKDSEIA